MKRSYLCEEFLENELSKATRMQLEMRFGEELLKDIEPWAWCIGSARLGPDTPDYQLAYEVCSEVAKICPVLTGGGPSIMEACNKAAHEQNQTSIGISIDLPFEQVVNEYQTHTQQCRYFSTRKFLCNLNTRALIAFTPGVGTLEEMLEVMTLVQTKCQNDIPLILVGSEIWNDVWLKPFERMVEMKTMSESNRRFFHIVDTPQEVVSILNTTGGMDQSGMYL